MHDKIHISSCNFRDKAEFYNYIYNYKYTS